MSDKQAGRGRSVSKLPASGDEESQVRSQDGDIYTSIYTAIVEHYIAPGTKLPEDALADSFHVSRTIIRKVLSNLAHDGLVTSAPKRGARVAQPTVEEAKEVFEARRILEVATIPLIADMMTERDIKRLRKQVQEQKKAELAQDPRRAIRLSGQFHKALIAIIGNTRLNEFLRNLISRSSLIIAVYGSTKGDTRSCQDHDDLLDLFEANKTDECARWMEDHLRDVEATLDFGTNTVEALDFAQVFGEIQARGAD